jgi:hypothetical protein
MALALERRLRPVSKVAEIFGRVDDILTPSNVGQARLRGGTKFEGSLDRDLSTNGVGGVSLRCSEKLTCRGLPFDLTACYARVARRQVYGEPRDENYVS